MNERVELELDGKARPSATQLGRLSAPGQDRPIRLATALVAGAATLSGALYLYHIRHRPTAISAGDAAAINLMLAGQDTPVPTLAGIPNVSVEYYDIDAADAPGIRAELEAKGLAGRGGQRFAAMTRWDYRWHWPPQRPGSCVTNAADISFRARIILPRLRHAALMKQDVANAWRSYMTALVLHEAGHVRIGYGARERILDAVRSSSCDNANDAGNAAIAEATKEDVRFDERTNHGAADGAQFNG